MLHPSVFSVGILGGTTSNAEVNIYLCFYRYIHIQALKSDSLQISEEEIRIILLKVFSFEN